ncbi:MAG: hypothetical protein F6K24_51755 [Okeania sp. SIO2D1]|nr:hypothetical protein [Okeania sp. SIO2D1]
MMQLEQENTQLQEHYQKQTHKLFKKEKQTQELHSRLNRQQRHSLQLKAALDKCLEVSPGSSSAEVVDNEEPPVTVSGKSNLGENLYPKAQPIKPWSLEESDFENSTLEIVHLSETEVKEETKSNATELARLGSIIEEEIDQEDLKPTTAINARELLEEVDELMEEKSFDDSYEPAEEVKKDLLTPSSWPSPVLYPLRPHKKRKSFAAIELPDFPRYRPS